MTRPPLPPRTQTYIFSGPEVRAALKARRDAARQQTEQPQAAAVEQQQQQQQRMPCWFKRTLQGLWHA